MTDDHLCHCGHEQLFHFDTNNRCMIIDCPCSEGFQPRWMQISPTLEKALNEQYRNAQRKLRELNDEGPEL